MKHLKRYKLFESDSNLKQEVLEIYQDFLDHFNMTKSEHGDYYVNRRMSLFVTDRCRFGEGVRVVIQNGNVNGGYLIKEGPSKGFDGVPDDVASELKKAHDRCLQHFDFKECVIGSYYKYQSGNLSISYYTNPSFVFEGKKFNPEYLCGEDSYVRELPLLKSYVVCKSSHENIFDFFNKNGNIDGMYCLWGGKGPMNYYNPISIMSGHDCDKYGHCIANSPTEQWITNQWDSMCNKYDIPKLNKSWNISRSVRDGDPTVYEFMDYLVENQEDFKNYKQLPKVNKDRR